MKTAAVERSDALFLTLPNHKVSLTFIEERMSIASSTSYHMNDDK